MNLPFGLPVSRESSVKRREDNAEVTALYERKLSEYRDSLEFYKKCIIQYASKLDTYDRRSMDNQMAIIESALDMTYIKEQGDKTLGLISDMKTGSMEKTLLSLDKLMLTIADTNYRLENIDKTVELLDKSMNSLDQKIGIMAKDVDGIDKNVVNRLSELFIQIQKQTVYQNKELQTELVTGIDKLHKSVKKGHILLWMIFICNFLGICGAVVYVLYYLEIIPFW